MKEQVKDNWVFWRPLAHGVATLEDIYGPPPFKDGYPMTWVLKASYALEIKSEREEEHLDKEKKKQEREAKKRAHPKKNRL